MEELHRHQQRVLQEVTRPPVLVEDARKVYATADEPVVALDGVSLAVARGEMVALVGPSGCGKSSLLNLIGCIDLPTSGRVVVDGALTSSLSDDALTVLRRDRVGTIFQFFNLLPALTLRRTLGRRSSSNGLRRPDRAPQQRRWQAWARGARAAPASRRRAAAHGDRARGRSPTGDRARR